ncbi:MAG: hypothetical protein ACRD47_05765 [Nitrososphaeraceae archaeon]
MVVIEQIIEICPATALKPRTQKRHLMQFVYKAPSLLMIFSRGGYTELNYSVSFRERVDFFIWALFTHAAFLNHTSASAESG